MVLKEKKIEKGMSSWLWERCENSRWLILLLMLVQVIHGGSGVLYALWIRGAVDAAVKQASVEFWGYCLRMLLLVAAQLLMRALIRHLDEEARTRLENSLKNRLFSTLLRGDYASISALHSGEWMLRLTNDTKVVADTCVGTLPGFCGMVVKMVSAFVMMAVMDLRFTLIMIPAGLLFGLVSLLLRRPLKSLHKRVQDRDGKLRGFLQEQLGSLLVIKAFSAEEQTERKAAGLMEEHRSARMKRRHFTNFSNVGLGIMMQGMYLGTLVWCAHGILTGRMTAGTLTAMVQLISQLQTPVANMSSYLPKYYSMIASAERIREAEFLPTDGRHSCNSVEEELKYYQNVFKSVESEQLDFSYSVGDDRKRVLHGFNISLPKGTITALCGPSGCGKSTLLKLMLAIYQADKGEIYLLNQDGSREQIRAERRGLFAYVPQVPSLMQGTVREALCLSRPEMQQQDAILWEALRIACAEEFVKALDRGLETVLGERGSGFSEGQLQRLAVARALVSGNPILLLDESTASLDQDTEANLLQNLKQLKDKTVVIVTHRPAALTICHQVIHMQKEAIS